MGMDIRQTNCPSRHKGGTGGYRGSTIQKSWEAVRLAQTLVHICGFIWEWTYAKYKSPLKTPGGISGGGGVSVSHIQKFVKAAKRLDRLAPNLAHLCRSIWEWIYAKQIAPRDTRGHLGGFRGSTIQKSWGAVKRLDRLAPTLVHVCGFIREWTEAKSKSTLNTFGAWGGHPFKGLGKLSNGCTDWHQIWYTSAESSGNGHKLNTIRPTIPQGHWGGGLGGHKFKCSGKLSNGWTDWHLV